MSPSLSFFLSVFLSFFLSSFHSLGYADKYVTTCFYVLLPSSLSPWIKLAMRYIVYDPAQAWGTWGQLPYGLAPYLLWQSSKLSLKDMPQIRLAYLFEVHKTDRSAASSSNQI